MGEPDRNHNGRSWPVLASAQPAAIPADQVEEARDLLAGATCEGLLRLAATLRPGVEAHAAGEPSVVLLQLIDAELAARHA